MKFNYFHTLGVILPFMLAGCVDDSYDLENINTDIAVKINDLVVPINLDAITLSNVFDLEDDSVIKEGADGEYAIIIDGDFNSDPINISSVTIDPGTINPINSTISRYEESDVKLPPVNIGEIPFAYEINDATTDFSFSSTKVDKSIRSLDKIKGEWTINLNMKVVDSRGIFKSLEMQNVALVLPEGFHTSDYQCANGIINVGNISLSGNTSTDISFKIDEIDFTKLSAEDFSFNPAAGNANNGSIRFDGKIGISHGFLVGKTLLGEASIPHEVSFITTPTMSKITVNSVSGVIGLKLDNLDAQDARLSDLPDFLNDDNTRIILANPQLYFGLNNPMAADRLAIETGLQLDSYKDSQLANSCALDNNGVVKLGYDKGVAGPYNFCLSPMNPSSYYGNYSGAQYVPFTSLSKLLEGNGLPTLITINFIDPCIPDTYVTDFAVDRSLAGVKGSYSFYSPLQFGAGSQIVYAERETGWNDETIEKIRISRLEVNAVATNNLPFDITLSGVPLDENGDPCKDPNTGQVVKIQGFTVKAGAVNQTITLSTQGTIKGLDGIEYRAEAIVTDDSQPLKSSMPIKLDNIRVTISGDYIDTL